jgi:hypothetical protein
MMSLSPANRGVPCPTCGALTGQPCHETDGSERLFEHDTRIGRAQGQARGRSSQTGSSE